MTEVSILSSTLSKGFGYVLEMNSWTPLWSQVVTSSIWEEDVVTRVVWITMLAVKDKNGYVSGSVSSMARLANVALKDCEKAIRLLESPDRRSPGQSNEGRRIQPVEKGWVVINHEKYRTMIREEYRRHYKAKKAAEYRAKKKDDGKPLRGEQTFDKRLGDGASEEELDRLTDG